MDNSSTAAVHYRWRLLRAATFRLDGGSMFGLVPRVVWNKAVPTDDRGRIELNHNCLLLERTDQPGTIETCTWQALRHTENRRPIGEKRQGYYKAAGGSAAAGLMAIRRRNGQRECFRGNGGGRGRSAARPASAGCDTL